MKNLAATLHAPLALLPQGWVADVRVRIGEDGRIAAVETDPAPPGPEVTRLDARALLPAVANLHSHAHQRAMAGLGERRGRGGDSFWSWRRIMYALLERYAPEHLQAIAALAYKEMLEAGFASVGEFHYLHHQPGGAPYAEVHAMSAAIAAAARTTGIGLTLLPVLYARGGADGRPLTEQQLRFANDPERFARIMEGTRTSAAETGPDARAGLALHSLRAVGPHMLRDAVERHGEGPIHVHAAEQVAEVDEVRAALGAPPVAWLLDNAPVDPRWCLIHATHMTPEERQGLARSGAVAGLCPITEANLGDGTFDAARYLHEGGRLGIGSDSLVRISLAEELRTLEYGQRLRDRARCVLAEDGQSTGRALYEAALAGGARALGRASGAIAEGAWADLVTLDLDALPLAGCESDQILDAWVFAASDRQLVRDVWAAGRHVVREGRHVTAAAIEADYRRTVAVLSPA